MSALLIESLADRILDLENEIDKENVRFVSVSVGDTSNFVNSQKNKNTSRMTQCHMKLFTSWLKDLKNELRKPEEIEPRMLDMYIAQFLLGVRKDTSENISLDDPRRQYEPDTLAAMHSSIHRYLSDKLNWFVTLLVI